MDELLYDLILEIYETEEKKNNWTAENYKELNIVRRGAQIWYCSFQLDQYVENYI